MEPGTSLVETLELERACCARLAALLDAERRAVAAHDLDALLASLRERETVHARWRHAASARAAALAGSAPTDPAAASLVAQLRAAGADLARALRVNAAIVGGALAQVSDILAAVRRAQPGSRYDDHATLTAPLPSASRAGWSA